MVEEVGEDAVRRATGHGWAYWFAQLDRLGGADHTERARRLSGAHPDLSGWWCQCVTVQYERARGLRDRHETTRGFQVSVQRTVRAPPEAAWAAVRAALLPGAEWREGAEWDVDGVPVTVRIARADQLRFWWHGPDGRSTAVVTREERPTGTAVRVQCEGLPSREAVEAMRSLWREALERVARAV